MHGTRRPVELLRAYLEDVGFSNLYRYIVSILHYYRTPLIVTSASAAAVADVDSYLEGSLDGRRLLWTLLALRPAARSELSERERELAAALAEVGLLREDGDMVMDAGWQLICVGDVTLFIDAAITFRSQRTHDVYIGPDTTLLLYYLDAARIRRGDRALDLCTGTGVLGLCAARAGAQVVSTDIADEPLYIAGVNRALNGLEEAVEIRREDLGDTLQRPERFALVTCNPPFIAVPPELPLSLFARGPGRDGLDMMRRILAALDGLLTERGTGLFVADLLGDDARPFFVSELAEAAKRFAVEVYIEQRLPAAEHAQALARAVTRIDPSLALEATSARLRRFILEELGARQIYLTVMRVRRSTQPGLLVCNRWRKA